MKFLHVIPPHAVNAYNIVKFMKKHFSEDEHQFLIMETRNWVINHYPRLLAFLDLNYLPEANKKLSSKLLRLKSTMAWMNEADHIVLHSVFSIRGKLFMPFFCRKRYAKKCIWVETYSDILRWRHSGKGIKARLHNYILGRFLRSIPAVGANLLSDKLMYQRSVGGAAEFFLAPYPVMDPNGVSVALNALRENGFDPENIQFFDYQELMTECEESFRHRLESMEQDGDGESGGEEIPAEEETGEATRGNIENHLLMVEGDMFARHNHFTFFRDIAHLKDEGLIAANLNHVGRNCYSGSVAYRRMMYRAGKRFLGGRYIDFNRPNATKEFFYECLSKVDGIAFFSQRTLNPQFIWLMLMMDKKVFLPGNSPLYKYLEENQVPVFPHHYIREMTMEQFLRPIRTSDCEWIQTFIDEEKIAACWEEMFLAAQQRKEGTR